MQNIFTVLSIYRMLELVCAALDVNTRCRADVLTNCILSNKYA